MALEYGYSIKRLIEQEQLHESGQSDWRGYFNCLRMR